MASRTALLAGATGLVGGHLLDRLLADRSYERVIALVRRAPSTTHPKLDARVVDFDALASVRLPHVDDVFCALGTTIRTTGSQEAFRKVDLTYVVAVARAGRRSGARQLLVVSSLGADERSSIFYSRVKGEMEREVSNLGYDAVQIFRPSIIAGERRESRAGERIGLLLTRALGFLLIGPLRRYRAVHADTIAAAMLAAATRGEHGVVVHESEQIARQGASARSSAGQVESQ